MTGKVLIVDDTVENLRILGDLLEDEGYDIRVATSGEQALETIAVNPPDVILLDVLMPGGLNGYDVCHRLKADERTAGIPVIFLTAFSSEEDEVRGLEAGAVDFVMKPFRLPVVLRRVANHLAYRHLQRELEQQAAGLEQLVARRTDELKRVNDRLTKLDASKALYLKLLAREVRAPAEGLIGIGELALQAIESAPKRERLRGLFRAQKERLEFLFDQYHRLVNWQQVLEGGPSPRKSRPVRLDELLARAWEPWAASERPLVPPPPEASLIVRADPKLLEPVLDGLVRWMAAVAQGRVGACYEDSPSEVKITWTLAGAWPELPETPVGTLSERQDLPASEALAWLPLADTTVEALGGSVTVSAGTAELSVTLRLPAFPVG